MKMFKKVEKVKGGGRHVKGKCSKPSEIEVECSERSEIEVGSNLVLRCFHKNREDVPYEADIGDKFMLYHDGKSRCIYVNCPGSNCSEGKCRLIRLNEMPEKLKRRKFNQTNPIEENGKFYPLKDHSYSVPHPSLPRVYCYDP